MPSYVSIPGGFSCTLRPNRAYEKGMGARGVSIPGGFSCTLRLYLHPCLSTTNQSFNPWRVFLHVATKSCFVSQCPDSLFQSLAGFLARCDIKRGLIKPQDVPTVSIPGGFSCTLRRRAFCLPLIQKDYQFQSLAGFLARCDATCPDYSMIA